MPRRDQAPPRASTRPGRPRAPRTPPRTPGTGPGGPRPRRRPRGSSAASGRLRARWLTATPPPAGPAPRAPCAPPGRCSAWSRSRRGPARLAISAIDQPSKWRSAKADRSRSLIPLMAACTPRPDVGPGRDPVGPGVGRRQHVGAAVVALVLQVRSRRWRARRRSYAQLAAMRCSQLPTCERSSNWSSRLYARRNASWTTSSASCSFPVIRWASRKSPRLCRSTSRRKPSRSPARALASAWSSLPSIRSVRRSRRASVSRRSVAVQVPEYESLASLSQPSRCRRRRALLASDSP